jgi:dTDP-4-dehydrorhamnose reductase
LLKIPKLKFDVVFLGLGPISKEIARRMICLGLTVAGISDQKTDPKLESSREFGKLKVFTWEEIMGVQITSGVTYVAWRSQYGARRNGYLSNGWAKSSLLNTDKLIHFSSASVYSGTQKIYSESDFDLSSYHEKSNQKQKLEFEVKELAETKGIPYNNYRISNVYGFKTIDGFISESIHNLKQGKPLQVYKNIDVVRDYLFLDDLVNAIILLHESRGVLGNLNFSTGIGVKLSVIISLFENLWPIDFGTNQILAPIGIQELSILNCKKLQSLITWNPKQIQQTLPLIIENATRKFK